MRILTAIRDGFYGTRPRESLAADEAPEARPQAIDIENHLDAMPGADHLNWRTSIADLMTLIGVDASFEAREALAQELGYDGPPHGSREMDNWLHARVLAEPGHARRKCAVGIFAMIQTKSATPAPMLPYVIDARK